MPTFMVVHFLSLRLLVSTYVGASCHKYCTGVHEEMLTLALVNLHITVFCICLTPTSLGAILFLQ